MNTFHDDRLAFIHFVSSRFADITEFDCATGTGRRRREISLEGSPSFLFARKFALVSGATPGRSSLGESISCRVKRASNVVAIISICLSLLLNYKGYFLDTTLQSRARAGLHRHLGLVSSRLCSASAVKKNCQRQSNFYTLVRPTRPCSFLRDSRNGDDGAVAGVARAAKNRGNCPSGSGSLLLQFAPHRRTTRRRRNAEKHCRLYPGKIPVPRPRTDPPDMAAYCYSIRS